MTSRTGKILVLDDESELRALLQRYLTEQGYEVRAIPDAGQIDRLLQREPFDVLILDIMMPGEDGLTVCQRLRTRGETIPILMLTARGDPVDRILGREVGADDYLSKPFNPRELLACIHALLRRQQMLGRHRPGGPSEPVRFGPFVFDIATRRLLRDAVAVPLTSGELDLLVALALHAGEPLSREKLIGLTRGRDAEASDRSIDVQVVRLRRVIEADPAHPLYVQTVRGIGYVLVPDPSPP
jgi:two-component system, OmpR family, phosphate regulon response regulator OmpR